MATRTHAREMVVELLYAYAMGNERIFDFADELLNAKKIRNAQADFAKGLFNGVVAHLQNIDSIIEANLKSWELSRLGVIDKCILRLGVYEILKGEIDAPVAINEAIEIAKILGAENTGRFVNGVLDAIRKGGFDLEKGVELVENSSLGAPCGDLANFKCSQTTSLVSHSKFAKNSTTSTANTRIVDSNKNDSKQPKKKNNRAIARTKSRPICGAKKYGESKKPKNDRFAKSTKKPTNRTKTTKKTQKSQNANSSIVSEKLGLRSHERGNKTKASIDEVSGKSPRFVATRRICKGKK